uniref:Putative secreted metalloprotease n=1 Tax=Ixodes ricinus TaxID=34613 RepID=A0A6B0V9X6_IXORI
MNAPKLRELLLLLLSASVSAAGESATGPEQTGCIGQATTETWYVGVYIVTDNYFRSCTPYKNHTLEEYLEAFVGGVRLYFQGLRSPAIEIVYLGSRNLNADEEREIIGSSKKEAEIAVKGGDALRHIMGLSLEMDELKNNPGNILLLVLTGLNITEEETKNSVNTDVSISDSSENDEDYDNSAEDSMLLARAASEKKLSETVGGLSQYGSICLMTGAIVQDNGRNFSGVSDAAEQVANVLGPMYNGTIPKRNCDEDDFAHKTFHGKECKARKTLSEEKEKFSCLNESIDGTESQVMTPYEFYKKNPIWTPCGTSYPGSEECQNSEVTKYKHQNCSISCCMRSALPFMDPPHYPIPAPDGEECNLNEICVGGTCVTTRATLNEHPPKR